MFKNIFKKTNIVVLILLVLNLGLGSLFLAPIQTQSIFMDPQEVLDVMTNLSDGEELAELTQNELIDVILNDEKIPENLKQYLISSIQNFQDISENTQNLLIDIILEDGTIPEELKLLVINAINANENVTGLIQNWLLDLLLKHVDIEHICKSFSDIAANIMILGTTVGTSIAIAISQMCPIILNEILEAFLQTLPEPPAPANIQSIEYPIFDSYQWEVGIPGFTSPGEITPF